MPTQNIHYSWDIELPDVNATEHLAMDLAATVGPGDLVTFSGDLGAGKTTLVRAILRYLAGDAGLDVPSPTFTLSQVYELPQFPVVHADLFRVSTVAELSEIGWHEGTQDSAVLVEWPDRAGALLQADRLDVSIGLVPKAGPSHRRARLSGHGRWAARVAQLRNGRKLLDSSGFGSALRMRMQGDASTRSYERLHPGEGDTAILMKMPASAELRVRGARRYNAIAHLAETVHPFVAMARALRERGFSAPELYSADLDSGLLLLEDFGVEPFVRHDPPVPFEDRYEAAIDLLVTLHGMPLPERLPIAPRVEHRLPEYDIDALLIECEQLFDWYLPYRGAALRDAASRDRFLMLWRLALAELMAEPKTWVLRDFHSPNLLWLPERSGIARVGLLDFQDAVLGHAAYDVASLLMDARADVSESLALKLLSRYAVARKAQDPDFDPVRFAERYVLLGAQRATKILGIFARLYRGDRKPQYLRHLPRVWNYLMRAFEHPKLAEIKSWYVANVPPPAGAESAPPRTPAAARSILPPLPVSAPKSPHP